MVCLSVRLFLYEGPNLIDPFSFSPPRRKKDPRRKKQDRRHEAEAVTLVERGRRLLPVGDVETVEPFPVKRGPVEDGAVSPDPPGPARKRTLLVGGIFVFFFPAYSKYHFIFIDSCS